MKNRWLALILNFVIPGLGWFYVGSKRPLITIPLIVAWIIGVFIGWNSEEVLNLNDSIAVILELIIGLFFGLDAFQDAEELNKKSKKRNKK